MMKKLWKEYSLWIIIAAIVLTCGIGALVYLAVLKKGKSEGLTQGVSSVLATIPVPNNGDDWTNAESMAIRAYANWLKDEFHWYSIHNRTQWDSLSADSDRILLGVSEQYFVDNNTDLLNDIASTTFVDPLTWTSVSSVQTRLGALINR